MMFLLVAMKVLRRVIWHWSYNVDKDDKKELYRQKQLSSIVQSDGRSVIQELMNTVKEYIDVLQATNLAFKKRGILQSTIHPSVNNTLIEKTERLLLRSFFLGFGHGLEDKPSRKNSNTELGDFAWGDGVVYDSAAQFLKSKIPITRKEWNRIEPLLRFRAFTVARLGQIDQIEIVRRKIAKAIETGQAQEKFIKELNREKVVQATGLKAENPTYWKTVYRTNINTAYNAGRMMANAKPPKPLFYKFSALIDARVTHICRERNGIIKSAKDPWWNSNTPSLHYNCRSTLIPLYTHRNVTPDKAVPPAQKGFGENPYDKGSFWSLSNNMVKRANKYNIGGDIVQVALQLGMKNYALSLVKGLQKISEYKNGGWVKEAKNREEKSKHQKIVRKTERAMARRLAKDGHKVYLLPESKLPGMKNPDAIVDGKVFEFKVASNIKKAEIRILQGWKKAEGVALEISDNIFLDRLYGKLLEHHKVRLVWIIQERKIHKWTFR